MTLPKLSAFFVQGFELAWSRKINFLSNYFSRLLSVLFFFFLDQLFRKAGLYEMEGGSYFTFLLIGGGFARFLELTMRAFAENLREQMLTGTLEPLLATANSTLFVMLGSSIWPLVENTFLILVQFAIGTQLGADFSNANWLSVLVITLLGLFCVLSYGIFAAAFTLLYKRADPIQWLNATVLQVFSGVFFPITVMPPALQVISYLLPFTYTIHGLRSALIRGENLAALKGDIFPLLGFSLILIPLSLWMMKSAVRRLQRTGEMGHY